MEMIKLKDGTVFNIEDGATQNSVAIIDTLENIAIYEEAFTEENLERFEILNEKGLTTAIIKDKFLRSIECIRQEDNDDEYKLVFGLGDVDMNAKRIKALEEAQAGLMETQAEIIEYQDIQDGLSMIQDTFIQKVVMEVLL